MSKKAVLLLILILVGAGWWGWHYQPTFRNTIEQYASGKELLTLEARYTADNLMTQNRKELLPDNQYIFQEPVLRLYPYTLLDVKFVQPDRKTREGLILWCQTDGEMVLDSESWEKTHGFEDAINAGATRNDFKVMLALAKNNGSLSREELQEELHIEADTLAPWINSVIEKQLVVAVGKGLQLHLENPKILVLPQTKIKQAFVTKPSGNVERVSKTYSVNQIEKVAKAAFGPTFTIRSTQEVYLPVYSIHVQNPDGTIHTTYWNGVNGKRIDLVPLT